MMVWYTLLINPLVPVSAPIEPTFFYGTKKNCQKLTSWTDFRLYLAEYQLNGKNTSTIIYEHTILGIFFYKNGISHFFVSFIQSEARYRLRLHWPTCAYHFVASIRIKMLWQRSLWQNVATWRKDDSLIIAIRIVLSFGTYNRLYLR